MVGNYLFEQFITCAPCFAPYLTLQDIITLIRVSQKCFTTFTSSHIWLPICARHNIQIEAKPITNPYAQLRICSPGLNVAAHWRLDTSYWESSNPNLIKDHSGNKQHLLRVPQPPRGYVPDKSSHLTFFAYGQNTTHTLNAKLNFTAEIILNPSLLMSNSKIHEYPVLSKHNGGNGWEIRCKRNQVSFMITPAPYQRHEEIICPINIEKQDWMHIAGTFDGTTMCLYIDGEIRQNRKYKHPVTQLADTNALFSIGYNCNEGWQQRCCFRGSIAEARICYSTLQPDQFLKVNK